MKCLLYMYEWRCTIHYCIPIIVISVSYAAAIAVYYYAFFAEEMPGSGTHWMRQKTMEIIIRNIKMLPFTATIALNQYKTH